MSKACVSMNINTAATRERVASVSEACVGVLI